MLSFDFYDFVVYFVLMNLGIIGPNTSECTTEIYNFGVELGQFIAKTKHVLICGGMGGFMEAVCKGVKESPFSFLGKL